MQICCDFKNYHCDIQYFLLILFYIINEDETSLNKILSNSIQIYTKIYSQFYVSAFLFFAFGIEPYESVSFSKSCNV